MLVPGAIVFPLSPEKGIPMDYGGGLGVSVFFAVTVYLNIDGGVSGYAP